MAQPGRLTLPVKDLLNSKSDRSQHFRNDTANRSEKLGRCRFQTLGWWLDKRCSFL